MSENTVVKPSAGNAPSGSRNRTFNPLSKSAAHFARASGPDLLARTEGYWHWQNARKAVGMYPYTRILQSRPGDVATISDETGHVSHGVNFASQDYLSLSFHPRIRDAAMAAIERFGPHSAGSGNLLGNTTYTLELERAIADWLGLEHVALFPTGWGAGFGTVTGLVRPDDHILIDRLAHACLRSGASAATPKITEYRHLDTAEVRQRLRDIRAADRENGILVITEGLFSMDSDSPDLVELQSLCREYGATLLVDVAHDLGATGPDGAGQLGVQGMLGNVDLVVGSFSKTFASNGGFLASASPAVRQYVKWFGGPHIFSNALSPLQTAVVREAISIIRSSEGEALRAKLAENIVALRDGISARGGTCMGDPSPIVAVLAGSEAIARTTSALIQDRGVLANLVEFPAVAIGSARLRLQVMASHSPEQARRAAEILSDAIEEARAVVRSAKQRDKVLA